MIELVVYRLVEDADTAETDRIEFTSDKGGLTIIASSVDVTPREPEVPEITEQSTKRPETGTQGMALTVQFHIQNDDAARTKILEWSKQKSRHKGKVRSGFGVINSVIPESDIRPEAQPPETAPKDRKYYKIGAVRIQHNREFDGEFTGSFVLRSVGPLE